MVAFKAEGQERAFGAPGEPGDPDRIENLARHLIRSYEESERAGGRGSYLAGRGRPTPNA